MKAIRIFLKPNAETFIDMGVADDFSTPQWWLALRKDGAALAHGAIVPLDAIHHAILINTETPASFTVVPGGKLN